MTEFTLKVFIYGLIGIVPLADGSHKLLLLDSAHHNAAHVPVIAAKGGGCIGTLCKQDDVLYWRNSGECVAEDAAGRADHHLSLEADGSIEQPAMDAAWLLADHHLSLEIDGSIDGPQKIKADKGAVAGWILRLFKSNLPRFRRAATSCSWGAEVAKARGGSGVIQQACLDDWPCDGVVATMQLGRGRLRTAELTRGDSTGNGEPPVISIRFKPSENTTYEQALTEAFVLEVQVRGRGVRLWRRAFESSTGESIYLTPGNHCGNRPCIELYLANNSVNRDVASNHFAEYYKLLGEPSGPVPTPGESEMPWERTGLQKHQPSLGCFPDFTKEGASGPRGVALIPGVYNKSICPPAFYEEP